MENSLSHIIEALLFSSSEAITAEKLVELTDAHDKKTVLEAIDELDKRYQGGVIALKKLASGYRFQVRENYSQWVCRLFSEKPAKYTRATLETLAIIAYRQPVTRADIEAIRGVSVSTNVIRSLIERRWIKVAGHRDVPGKPAIYITTKAFLDYFNLSQLSELPSIDSLIEENEQSMEDGLGEDFLKGSAMADLPNEFIDSLGDDLAPLEDFSAIDKANNNAKESLLGPEKNNDAAALAENENIIDIKKNDEINENSTSSEVSERLQQPMDKPCNDNDVVVVKKETKDAPEYEEITSHE